MFFIQRFSHIKIKKCIGHTATQQRINKVNGTKNNLYRYEYLRSEMQDPTLTFDNQ